ncbi:uncharacterized protein A1O9_08003 [Exophiala aquamarina CBS 119918]|uniref:Transcription factor domain-containing protein n=1 Tax=Exophiala aquamarina CBS 119918 TaxID=1182545 RepID=A0A072P9I9_9EURO|nr:uncharacterized protein A1O9_08003 [Exophiala aquamarina CBS 119918]KEF56422.1 hypothetical protein A1O9_08003 [Exophiala aquamarina CBS 119918]
MVPSLHQSRLSSHKINHLPPLIHPRLRDASVFAAHPRELSFVMAAMDSTSHNVKTASLKRIRILDQKQSRFGCRTCSAKSSATRASQHALDALGLDELVLATSGVPPWHRPDQQNMAQLTLSLFSHDPYQLHSKASAEFSFVLLPQLAATRPYVNAAAGTLGAAYDKCVLHQTHRQDHQLITRLYLNALRQVRDELQRPQPEVVPLLVTAMLLAAAESIQHKQKDAVRHLLGAFSMIDLQNEVSLKTWPSTSVGPLTCNTIVEGLNPIQDVFYTLDYHISMFAWGRKPRFPRLPVTNQMLYPASMEDLVTGRPVLQQWCVHFIAKALEPEWEERIDFPAALIAQQVYLVAWLKRWLRTYTLLFDNQSSQPFHAQTPRFRILKAQTLIMYIAVSNVKPPTQVTYDTYAPEFEEIIRCAEAVLSPNAPASQAATSRSLLAYSPVPGIIHPLCFTARKYRDSVSRRRAIHLLRQAGIEGPFQGDFEARVAARLVEIEEGRKPFKAVLTPAEVLLPSDIPDRKRVYMIWIVETPGAGSETHQVRETAQRMMKFSRRRRLAPTSRATKAERLAQVPDDVVKIGAGMGVQSGGHDDNAEGEMWEIWDEAVDGACPWEAAGSH